MYCPNCKQEYDGKFCPECGTKLIEKPADSGVSVYLGDANAISGGLHVADSHNVHNEDRSVHNITNTTSNVTNITQAQNTKDELKQEKLKQYLDACRSALADNNLDPSEEADLRRLSLELDIDEATADRLLNEVIQLANSRQQDTELPRRTKRELDKLADNLDNNDAQAIMQQLYGLEASVANYRNDELQYNYYLVLAALYHEKCIEKYECSKVDNYWLSFWTYIAYLKANKPANASQVFYSMDKKFPNQPQDNLDLLAAAGSLIKNNMKDAKDDLEDVEGAYSPLLISFAKSIYFLADSRTAKKMGADENTCAFYLVNFFGQKDPKAKAEEERLKREEAEAERRRQEEELKRKEEREKSTLFSVVLLDAGSEEKRDDVFVEIVDAVEDPINMSPNLIMNSVPCLVCSSLSWADAQNIWLNLENAGAKAKICADSEVRESELKAYQHIKEEANERRKKLADMKTYIDENNLRLTPQEVVQSMGVTYKLEEKVNYHPKTRDELKSLIRELVKVRGLEADLNDIDTSQITDMNYLFERSSFNGNISRWDVSRVADMSAMFSQSKFNGDISRWDVSNVKEMDHMFSESKFNGNISGWDVSDVESMDGMFADSKFNGDISDWNVSNVKDMGYMFSGSEFNGDISKWDVSNVERMVDMFCDSKFNGDISKWDVSNVQYMASMFELCNNFEGKRLERWDVSNVKSMRDMFNGCKSAPSWYKG